MVIGDWKTSARIGGPGKGLEDQGRDMERSGIYLECPRRGLEGRGGVWRVLHGSAKGLEIPGMGLECPRMGL